MEKQTKANRPLYLIMAVVVACALWLYVRNVENVDREWTISNIPITIIGEDVLEANNLMITGGRNATVSMRLQGRWNTVVKLNSGNITIRVDVSKITTSGEHPLVYELVWPVGVSAGDLAVLDRNPFYVTLAVSKRVTKSVEVRGIFEGSVAEGYQVGEFSFNPATVEISGQEMLVNQVSHALVVLNLDHLDESYREDMPVTLVGFDGKPAAQGVAAQPATVDVSLPVVMVKEIPLSVDILDGGGATEDNVTVSISPKTIWVSGTEETLQPLKEVKLGVIDLSKLISSDTYTFTIPLAAELTNVTGINEAAVSVKVEHLETITLETSNIEIVNPPEGRQVTAVTQSVPVLVRGPDDALELVLPQHIRVVADLKDLTLPRGQNIVPVKVYLDGGSGAGIVGEYKIAITVT